MNADRDDLSTWKPRFDTAWRRASDEEPPQALDAAIRAAARRELGARPQPADLALREARRPERWWFPLAAAATIGAIALGLLQLVGPDRLPAGGPPVVVSDMPLGTSVAPTAPGRPLATLPQEGTATPKERPDQVRTPAPPSAPFPAAPSAPPTAEAASGSSAGPTLEAAPASKRAPPATEPRQRFGEQGSSDGLAGAKSAPESREHPGPKAERLDSTARTALAPADWIALIRRLRDEGRDEEAAKELAAFRAAFPDHERLLPPDLARWQPNE